jgi:MFS family permease
MRSKVAPTAYEGHGDRPVPAMLGPRWLSHDARVVIAARALRTFGYGCTSVLLAGMLTADGATPDLVGLLLAVAAVGSVLASILMGLFADRVGRRTSLIFTAGLMGTAGLVFAFSESFPLLLAAAFIGTISPSTNDNSPFSGVEQAILAQTCPAERHTALFAGYSMAALLSGAAGGLAAAGLGLLSSPEPGDAAFLLYTVVAVLTAVLFLGLTPAAEPEATPPENAAGDPARDRKRLPSGPVVRLAGLFAVDAFAGGLAVQAILALWFQQRYGVSSTELGLLFFATNLLPALSQAVAPALARRRGLLTAMLVPHFLSNVLLLCVPVAPTFGLAAAVLLARQTLSKIDVPARQAFTAAIVTPEERTAAASLTTVARSVAVSASPLTSSLMLSGPLIACGAPLLLGGGLAIAYDLTMWRTFRRFPLGEGCGPVARVLGGRHRRNGTTDDRRVAARITGAVEGRHRIAATAAAEPDDLRDPRRTLEPYGSETETIVIRPAYWPEGPPHAPRGAGPRGLEIGLPSVHRAPW